MKIISVRILMPTTVYAEKHVYMYVRMDRWMDTRIYVRNVLCIMNVCVCGGMCVYVGIYTVIMYI